jgi:hypothetical protein
MNTPPGRPWGLREAPARVLVVAMVLAAILHLPAIPGQFSVWISLLFGGDEGPTGPQQEVTIPIDLDIGLVDDEAVEQPDAPGGVSPEAPPLEPEPASPEVSPDDFDDDDEGEEIIADAGAPEPDAGEDVVEEPLDAGAEPPADAAPPTGPIQDPFEVAGEAGMGAEHPNVRIYIAADVLRQRAELATMFGELLNSVPEWGDLLGGTDLNPIRDFDHLLISGPQMRDPRWIVATIDYNISSPKMKATIDGMVGKAKGGRWLDDQDVPVAAVAGDRRVVLLEEKRLVVILPASAEDQIPKLKDSKTFKKSGAIGIALHVITPHRAFKGFPMPTSVAWMRLRFTLAGAEDFQVEIEAQDESPEAARRHAAELERRIESLRPVPGISLFVDKHFIGKPVWEVDGDRFRARAPVSREQVRRIMRLIKEVVLPPLIARREAKKAPPAPKPVPKRLFRPPGKASAAPSAAPTAPPAP